MSFMACLSRPMGVLQGLSVRVAATAAGTTIAAVYMAKSRVGRLVRREIARLRDLEL